MPPLNIIHHHALSALPLALGLIEAGTAAHAQNFQVRSSRFGTVGVQYPAEFRPQQPVRSFSLQGGGGQSISTVPKPSSAQFTVEGGFAPTKIDFAFKGHLELGDFLNRPPLTLDTIPINIRIYSGLDGSLVEELDGLVGTTGEFVVLTDVNPAPLIDGVLYLPEISVKAPHWLRQRVIPEQRVALDESPRLTFSLINGDANGDNIVDSKDSAFVIRHLPSQQVAPTYEPNADLNGDAQVTADDLKIVNAHRGTQGDE